jgi:hypothetical protein
MNFDTEYENSEIRYKLVATVNGEVAGVVEDYDPDVVIQQVTRLEGEVAQLVESNLQDKIVESREALYGV